MILNKIRNYFLNTKYKKENILIINLLIIVLLPSITWVVLTSPTDLEVPYYMEIEKGLSIKQIGNDLKDKNVIRSKTLFSSLVLLTSKQNKVVAGEYLFHTPPTLLNVVSRVTQGEYGIGTVQIRIPEGFTRLEIADLLDEKLANFNKEMFLELTRDKEGYLFPDTYIFVENVKTEEVVDLLEDTFKSRLEDANIYESSISLGDIIKMASIIEKEATEESRQEVSNILWKRINIGMALQVDATFVYERGLSTFDLSIEDLEKDSPYNTYTNPGFPPTPISNPGIESIKAAAFPLKTSNLYFLTGNDGEMYYATSFEGHKRNKELYIY